MSDAFGPDAQQPSEEEVRAYLGQLRATPADQVLAELLSSLLQTAQVKLGRRDGRLLLDVAADVLQRTRDHLPAELTQQVDQVLPQLQLAQVEAEGEVAAAAAQGQAEPNDLEASAPAGDAPAAGQGDAGGGTPPPRPSSPPPPEPGGAASRLWVPGR